MPVFGSEEEGGSSAGGIVSVVGYSWCYFVKFAEVNYLKNKTGRIRVALAGIAQPV